MSAFYSFLAVFGVLAVITVGLADDDIFTSKVLNDKEYYVGAFSKVNWYRAAQTCAAHGMTLASIESSAEYESLRNYLREKKLYGNQYWLSGTNLPASSDYVWLMSGTRLSYTKWATNPSTTANQCVRTNDNFLWVTGACTESHYFICSRPVEPACGVFGRCQFKYNPNVQL
ncbi:macrophage mannose receptor 1 [Musca domestica]|uniref:Macrophage mannose receptor 1 n=1 Tax=Musca domestica TaxID=7370 RepID=A0A9J7CYW2_MUSDO|nr:macrophage mannose receptor 1 [Musca domestica]